MRTPRRIWVPLGLVAFASLVFLAAADSDAVAVTVDSLSAGHGGYAAVVRSPLPAALAALAGGCDTLARR